MKAGIKQFAYKGESPERLLETIRKMKSDPINKDESSEETIE